MTKYYSRSKQKFVDIEQMPDQYVRNAFVKMCKTEPTEDVIFAQQQSERADDLDKKNYDLINANKNLGDRVDYLTKNLGDGFISSVDDLGEIEFLRHHNKLDIQTINTKMDTILNMADQIKKLKKQLKDTTYQPYDKQGRVRDYQVEYTKLAKQRDDWKEKSMNMVEKSSYDELKKERDGAVDAISNSFEIILEENKQLKFQIEQVDRNQTVSKEAYDIAWQNMELWKKRYESQLPTPILGDVKMFSEIPNDPDGGSFVYLLRKYLNNVSYKIRVRGQYLDEQTKKTEGWKKYERGQPLEKSKCFRVYIDVKKDVD